MFSKRKNKNFVIVVSGVAGAGKDSVLDKLREMPESYCFSVSYTDRPLRSKEVEGNPYHHITEQEFSDGIEKGEFLEWESVRGQYRYGIKKSDFEALLASGKVPVMQTDVKGVAKLKKMFNLLSFFIVPPSLEEAERRLRARGSDTEEAVKTRTDRYQLEMGYKDQYDHIIINDDLVHAQNELLSIISKEKIKRNEKKKFGRNFSIFLSLLLAATFLGFGVTKAFQYYNRQITGITSELATAISDSNDIASADPTATSEQSVTPTPPAPLPAVETKKKIASAPPKYETSTPTAAVISTSTASNGAETTVIATGTGVTSADIQKAQDSSINPASPDDVVITDETGLYPGLGATLKSYLKNNLKWKSEISALKGITVRDAGTTGWTGQYLGSYTTSSDGSRIIGASGSIILNTTYYKDSPLFTDYMKLVLSHEYGHHYTLYHKWVDWNLPISVRFPDSYYTTRPLSKSTTATDYSKGWGNCEAEIIAEDYSYLYSGYGLQAMHATYGYPSAAIKTWLDNIGSSSLLEAAVNNPPTVNITAPATDSTLSGVTTISANATDDIGIAKVSFYINDTLLGEDTTAPYTQTLATSGYPNGIYIIKVVSFDGTLSASQSINVTFDNAVVDNVKPTVALITPNVNPFALIGDTMHVGVEAADNIAVDHIELYLDDILQKSWSTDKLNLNISFTGFPAGTYNLKFRAYDAAGNYAELVLVVNKS